MSSTRNPSEIIAIGDNRYYLGDLFDKHLHAGQDVEVFTSFGDKQTILKGEWVGKLFSYTTVKGGAALAFSPSGYFGGKNYYLRYEGTQTFDDALLRYNYAKTTWRFVMLGVFPIPIFSTGKLPTSEESDKRADDRDNKTKELDDRDKWLNDLKKAAFFVGAALSGYKSLTSEKGAEQLIFGGFAAYLAYEASTL